MGIILGLALFFIIWWTVLFAVLPLGVRTQAEAGEVVPGTPESAPAVTRMLRVVMITTMVSAVVFAIVWSVMQMQIIDLGSSDVGTGMPRR